MSRRGQRDKISGLIVRHERESEERQIEELVREAFWDVYQPGCSEHLVMHVLRQSPAYLAAPSLVAVLDGRLVGMIAYSRSQIVSDAGPVCPVAVFGPVAVLPDYQGRGIGAALIRRSIEAVTKLPYPAIAIYGNPAYYCRFGFKAGSDYGVVDMSGEPCEALQVLELQPGAMTGISGRLLDDDAFRISEEAVAAYDAQFPPRCKHAKATQLFLGMGVIRATTAREIEDILAVINDAAQVYRGVIPADLWAEPYMSAEELRGDMADGVVFYGYYVNGLLLGVMGRQDRGDVVLIRHAYVLTVAQRRGIGAKLLAHIRTLSCTPTMMGTWADATWAVAFYEKNGYELVRDPAHKDRLLQKYWGVPPRQIATSVVLADEQASTLFGRG